MIKLNMYLHMVLDVHLSLPWKTMAGLICPWRMAEKNDHRRAQKRRLRSQKWPINGTVIFLAKPICFGSTCLVYLVFEHENWMLDVVVSFISWSFPPPAQKTECQGPVGTWE